MDTEIPIRQQLTKAIDELPSEVLPELVIFIEYLRFKSNRSVPASETTVPVSSGSTFLLSIAGLGTSDEDDVSERDEEILADEIDPIRGWSLRRDNLP